MNNQQLIQVQRKIEQFFYKIRVNIALHSILQSSEFSDFQRQMRLAIENQVLYFAKVEKVNQVIGAQKIDRELLEKLLLLYPILQKFIDDSDYQSYLKNVSDKGIESAVHVLGLDKEFTVKDLDSIITNRVKESMGWVDDTTVDWIATTLQSAMKEGLSSYEIAKLLRDDARVYAEMRADTIAENEAAWMLGETQLDVYKQAGVEKKRLITSRDESVCIICLTDEEAGAIDINEAFPSGATTTPIHIRCRCFVQPVTQTPLAIE